MGTVDRERAAEILKISALVWERSTGSLYVVFLNRARWKRAKILLAGAGLLEQTADETDFHAKSKTYWLKIESGQHQAFQELLPKAILDPKQLPETPPIAAIEGGQTAIPPEDVARIEASLRQDLTKKKGTPFVYNPTVIVPEIDDSLRIFTATLLQTLQDYFASLNQTPEQLF